MSKISLQKASVDDHAQVFEYVKSFYRERPEEINYNSDSQLSEAIAKLLDKEVMHYFLILQNRNPVGVIQVAESSKKVAELVLVYVTPANRRQGIGQSALEQVLMKFEKEGFQSFKTEVHVENNVSQNLFKKLDFRHHSNILVRQKG